MSQKILEAVTEALDDLTNAAEIDFIESLKDQGKEWSQLSEKQQAWVERIYERL